MLSHDAVTANAATGKYSAVVQEYDGALTIDSTTVSGNSNASVPAPMPGAGAGVYPRTGVGGTGSATIRDSSLLITTKARNKKHRIVKYTVTKKTLTVKPGRKTTLSLTLSRAITKLLAAKKKLTFSITLTGHAGTSRTAKAHKTLTVHTPVIRKKR